MKTAIGITVVLSATPSHVLPPRGRRLLGAVAVVLVCGLLAPTQNANGQIYIATSGASPGSGKIAEYSTSGTLINSSLVSGLDQPIGLALNGNNLLVGSGLSGAIGEYATSGATVNADLANVGTAGDIAVSGSHMFVADQHNGVYEFNTSGGASVGSIPLSEARGVAVLGGNLFVSLPNANVILEYSATGLAGPENVITADLNHPLGLATDGTDLFVADDSDGTIAEYDASGNLVNGSLISGLQGPYDLTISDGDIYVVNGGNGTVGEYTTAGTTVNADLISGLSNPEGIVVVPQVSSAPDSPAWVFNVMGAAVIAALFAIRRRMPGQSLPDCGQRP